VIDMAAFRIKATLPDGTRKSWTALAPSSTCAAIAVLKHYGVGTDVFVEPKK
jgi:hypothetical protein